MKIVIIKFRHSNYNSNL